MVHRIQAITSEIKSIEDTVRFFPRSPWDHQSRGAFQTIEALNEWDAVTMCAPTGCHAKGHPILMFDGTIKNVEDVIVGDTLMGPDSKPRTVLSLARGKEDMYRIDPKKGESFTVNKNHILSLECHKFDSHKDGEVCNISIEEYLKRNNNFKHNFKLRRVAVEFQEQSLVIKPYHMGILIGDGGFTGTPHIHKADQEIVDAALDLAYQFDCKATVYIEGKKGYVRLSGKVRGKKTNALKNAIEDLGLLGMRSKDKFIPDIYLKNSSQNRLEVLAGLLDTDGHLSNTYDFISKSRAISEGVVFLARSLGFAAYIKEVTKSCQNNFSGTYHRVSISGDLSRIPCRIPRKQANERKQIKSVLRCGFDVTPVGEDEFYGFHLDSDHLYVDGYFNVHHNSGKSLIASAFLNMAHEANLRAMLITNRRMLTKQTMDNLEAHGIPFGVRAASQKDRFDPDQPIQISSLPTEISRVLKSERWTSHKPDLIIVDESHLQAKGESLDALKHFMKEGAKIIGVTATPIEVSHLYPKLVVCATNSELRKCGAHVPVCVKAPFEFDLSKVGRVKTGEFDLGDIRKEVWSHAIVGNIIQSWREFNPDVRPTLLFAPGVPESIEMASEFYKAGYSAASIDATAVWINGEEYKDTPDGRIRNQVMEDFASGEIKVITNRYVLREAIDCPYLYHEILATPMGSLKGYLQSVGRVMRKSEATPDQVLLTDHAGSVYRHGSPNEDRDWHAMYHMTDKEIVEKRQKEMQEHPEKDPITCPFCGTVRRAGLSRCPSPPIGCGRESPRKMRRIIQRNGKLKEVDGPIFRPSQTEQASLRSEDQKRWDALYWAARNSRKERGMNFKQMYGIFKNKYGHGPSGLARMPKGQYGVDTTWDREVRNVAMCDLT